MKAHLFNKYLNLVFVETGTFHGDGVQSALWAGFNKIISLEILNEYFVKALLKFFENDNVMIFHADSSKDLFEVIKNIDCRITFWLDGHLNDPALGRGSRRCPVLEELEQIERHPIKDHTILIDDVRLFGTVFFDYITIEQVQKAILKINDKYTFELSNVRVKYPNDVLVARVIE